MGRVKKVSFALGTRAFDLVYFHFVSFGLVLVLVSFRLVRKVFQFPNPHKMTKFYSRK